MPEYSEPETAARVLILEDDRPQLETLVALVEEEGLEAVGCSLGCDALQRLRQEDIDVAVVDLRLPDISDVELLEKLGAYTDRVSIIVNTGFSSYESASAAVNLGAFAYVEKGSRPEELRRHLHRAIERAYQRRSRGLQQRLRTIIEHSNEVFYVHDTDHKLMYVSPQCEQVFGYTPAEMQRLWTELVTDNPLNEQGLELTEAAIRTGRRQRPYLLEIRRKDGRTGFVEIDESPLKEENGDVVGVTGAVRDVTERKRAEDALRESEVKFKTVVEQSPEMIFINKRGRVVFANGRCEKAMGYTKDESVSPDFDFRAVVAPECQEVVEANFRAHMDGKEVPPYECTLVTKNGKRFEAIVSTALIDYEGDTAILGLATDITDRKQAEETLRRSETRFADIAENALEWIWEVDANGRYTYASPVVEKLLGYQPDELLGKHFFDLFHPEDREALEEAALEVFAQKRPLREFVNRNVHKNGSSVWLSTSGVPVLDERGKLLGYRGADTDVTERKQAAEELQASEERFRALFNQAADYILMLDPTPDGPPVIVDVNEAACRAHRSTRDELIGRPITAWDVGSGEHQVREIRARCMAGDTVVFESVHRRKDGSTFPTEVSVSLVNIPDQPPLILGIGRDLSERKEAEAALRESEARYRAIVEDQTEYVVRYLPDGTLTFVNDATCRMLGRSREEVTEDAFARYVHPDDLPTVVQRLACLTPQSPVVTVENRNVLPTGEVRLAEWTNRGIFDDQGNLIEIQGVGHDITERKQAEEALAERNRKLLKAQEMASIGFIDWDFDTDEITMSEEVQRLYRADPEKIKTGQELFHHAIHPEDLERVREELESAAKGRGKMNIDHRIQPPDGEVRWVNAQAELGVDEAGNPTSLLGSVIDITERKRAEEAVLLRDRAVDSAAEGISITDPNQPDHPVIYANQGFERVTGYGAAEVLGRNLRFLQGPDTDPETIDEIRSAIQEGEGCCVELLNYRKDGTPFWNRVTMTPVRDDKNKISHFVGVHADVTEVRESRRRLAEQLAELNHLYDTSPVGLCVLDADLRYVRINDTLAAMNGHPVSEHIGRTLGEVIPELAPETEPTLRRVLETGQAELNVEVRGTTPAELDVERHWLTSYYPIRFGGGELFGVGCVVQDITDRKQAENELLASEERMRLAVQNVPVLVDAFDEDGNLMVWNRECERVTGYTRDEMIGNPRAMELLYPDRAYREGVVASLREGTGDFRDLEFTLTSKDGGSRTVSWSNLSTAHPIPGWSTWAVGVDVTERERAKRELEEKRSHLEETLVELRATQQQIIAQERLRALGQMASGVAHDLNNSLSPVLGYAELAASAPDLPEGLQDWLEWVQTGARDAAAVVQRLRQFYRSEDDGPYAVVELGDLLGQIPELTRPKWRDEAQRTGRHIEVDLTLEDDVRVLGNPAELREVFTNLVFNAVNAMPNGGQIALGLHVTTEFAVVEVTDTGIGMTDEIARRCFEPFFTARKGEGTGLGMSVCHGIIQRHGGGIEIDSMPGRGTTVRVSLPMTRRSDTPAPEPIEDTLPSHRVLYIDDDHRVRQLAGSLFERLGQKADLADGGAEGIDKFQSNDYDVVVTDLGMPGIDGHHVTRIVKSTQPRVPVIMVTGWGSASPTETGETVVPPDEIVAKPLTASKLSRALRKVFTGTTPGS